MANRFSLPRSAASSRPLNWVCAVHTFSTKALRSDQLLSLMTLTISRRNLGEVKTRQAWSNYKDTRRNECFCSDIQMRHSPAKRRVPFRVRLIRMWAEGKGHHEIAVPWVAALKSRALVLTFKICWPWSKSPTLSESLFSHLQTVNYKNLCPVVFRKLCGFKWDK